jgi:hypothetical protein
MGKKRELRRNGKGSVPMSGPLLNMAGWLKHTQVDMGEKGQVGLSALKLNNASYKIS